jgi:hypothetical protein
MASCEPFYMSGIALCEALRKPLKGIILMTPGTTLTKANAKLLGANTTGWASIINQPRSTGALTTTGIYLDISRGVEDATEAAEMTTSNTGYKEQTGNAKLGLKVYGSISYADYILWLKANGSTFQVALVNEDGDVTGTITSTGAFKGFTGRLFTEIKMPTTSGDMSKQAPFDIIFDVYEEWIEQYTAQTNCTFQDLKNLNPVGCNAEVITAYDAGTGVVIVKVTKRADNTPVATMGATTNWEVLSAINDVTVTIGGLAGTDEAIGSYSITLPSALIGPVFIRGFVETATAWTYSTNPLRVV